MPTFETKRHVPFSAEQMYAVVADVEHYPEFLPLCTGLTISSRQKTNEGEQLVARMSVGYKAIRESFTTRVLLKPQDKCIDVSYLDGPFKYLDNRWMFLAEPNGSIVDFYISYEFRSILLGAVVGGMFEQMFRKFTEAFEARAHKVFGPPETS